MNIFSVLQVADTIWICEKETVTKWEGDIISYKDHLKAKVMKEAKKNAKSKISSSLLTLISLFDIYRVGSGRKRQLVEDYLATAQVYYFDHN